MCDRSQHSGLIAAHRVAKRQIVELQDRVAELEEIIGLKPVLAADFYLTPIEAKIFGMIMKSSGYVAGAAMVVAIWGAAIEADAPHDPRTVLKVHVFNLRNKLLAHGIEIATRIGDDYCASYGMNAANKQRARDAIINLSILESRR